MPESINRSRASFAAVWILSCVFFSCLGWLLSAIHQLNRAGYGVAVLLGIFALLALRSRINFPRAPRLLKLRKRFSRFWPLSFLVMATMVFAGGSLYAPINYDGLAY